MRAKQAMNVNQFKKKFIRGLAYKPLFYLPVDGDIKETPMIIKFTIPEAMRNSLNDVSVTFSFTFGYYSTHADWRTFRYYSTDSPYNPTDFTINGLWNRGDEGTEDYIDGKFYGSRPSKLLKINYSDPAPSFSYYLNDETEVKNKYKGNKYNYSFGRDGTTYNYLYSNDTEYGFSLSPQTDFIDNECIIRIYAKYVNLSIDIKNCSYEVCTFGETNKLNELNIYSDVERPYGEPWYVVTEPLTKDNVKTHVQVYDYEQQNANFYVYDYTDWDNEDLYKQGGFQFIQEFSLSNGGVIIQHPFENLKFTKELCPNLHYLNFIIYAKIYNYHTKVEDMFYFKNMTIPKMFLHEEILGIFLNWQVKIMYDVGSYGGLTIPRITLANDCFSNIKHLYRIIMPTILYIKFDYYNSSVRHNTEFKNSDIEYYRENGKFYNYLRNPQFVKPNIMGNNLFKDTEIRYIYMYSYIYPYLKYNIHYETNQISASYFGAGEFLPKGEDYSEMPIGDWSFAANMSLYGHTIFEWGTSETFVELKPTFYNFSTILPAYKQNWIEGCKYLQYIWGEFSGNMPSDFLMEQVLERDWVNYNYLQSRALFIGSTNTINQEMFEFLDTLTANYHFVLKAPFGVGTRDVNYKDGIQIHTVTYPTITNPELISTLLEPIWAKDKLDDYPTYHSEDNGLDFVGTYYQIDTNWYYNRNSVLINIPYTSEEIISRSDLFFEFKGGVGTIKLNTHYFQYLTTNSPYTEYHEGD